MTEAAPAATPSLVTQRAGLGILLLLLSIGFIVVVDTVAKSMTEGLHAFQIVWGYFVGIFVSLLGRSVWPGPGLPSLLRARRPVLQLLRAGFIVCSIGALFIGLTYLPIADATALGFMAPLFIVAMSGPVLGEKIGLHRWAAVIAGLVGVMVIVRPGGGIAHWAAAMPLLSAFAFAAYQISTRLLAPVERVDVTLFWTGAGGLLWTSLAVPFFWTPLTPMDWLAFLIIGGFGMAAHLCMIRAFSMAQASLLAPFNYSKLIWAAIAGYVVFGDVPTANTWAGAAVIVASGLYVVWRERVRARRAA